MRANLLNDYPDTTFDASESAIYAALPASPVSFVDRAGLARTTNLVQVPAWLDAKWYISFADAPTISANFGISFDFKASNGISRNQVDFEAVLMHEALHALGFASNVDNPATMPLPVPLPVWVLDLFRLDATLGTSIPAGTFGTSRRFLADGSPANLVTRLGAANRVWPLSFGNEPGFVQFAQYSHWRDNERIPEVNPIGIMDPFFRLGFLLPVEPGANIVSRYILESDIYALDTIGWDINPFRFFGLVPGKPAITGLPSGTIPNPPATLEWTAASGATSYSLYVFEGLELDDAAQVFELNDITATTSSIPSGLFESGQSYTVLVTAWAGVEFELSDPVSFLYCRCPEDYDNSGSNVPDLDDLNAFFRDWNEGDSVTDDGDPSADVDCTGVGSVPDASDLARILDVFANGCP